MMRMLAMVVALGMLGCGGGDAVTAAQPEPGDAASEPAQDSPVEAQAADAPGEAESGQDAATEAEGEAPETGPEASAETEAGCPDAPCQPADVNCDPACGAVDPACQAACDINASFPFTLPMGITRIRAPRLDAQALGCSSCGPSGAWWSFLARLPDESCGSMVGPTGLGFASRFVPKGEPAPDGTCEAKSGAGCASFGAASGPNPLETYVYLTAASALPGFVVTFDIRPSGQCDSVQCNGGCNGE